MPLDSPARHVPLRLPNMLLVAAILACCILATSRTSVPLLAESPNTEAPNVLVIYSDDQSYKTISCYGDHPEWVETPNIDALARRGVRFHRAYLGAWCMPSRASMLTGRLQHGIESMRMEGAYPRSTYDPEQCPFFPSELRKSGYETAQIGKWHTGVDPGYGRDWDYQVVWNRPAHPENAGHYFYDQILTTNGVDALDPKYSTDNYTDLAVDYINGKHREDGKPWYLWLCYGAVHGPTTPADRHLGSLKGNMAELPADILGPWPTKPAYLDKTSAWVPGPNQRPAMKKKNIPKSNFNVNDAGKSFDAWIQQMNECNMAIDDGVGRLMKALKDSGQLDNTLVIYTADQGYGLGEHGFNAKIGPYDATIASPLIISQPTRIPPGTTCEHPVNAPDLVELICNWTALELPWETHGRDIRPLLESPDQDWDRPMLFTHTGRQYGSDTDVIPSDEMLTIVGNVPWYVMLRDGDFKYVRTLVEGEMEELYNLREDPEELHNLALEAEHHSQVQKLRELAIQELERTDAGFGGNMPPTRAMQAQIDSQ